MRCRRVELQGLPGPAVFTVASALRRASWEQIPRQVEGGVSPTAKAFLGKQFKSREIFHGHSISIYLHDPEGNLIELYWPTGLDVKGPIGKPVDLSRSEEEILKAHLG